MIKNIFLILLCLIVVSCGRMSRPVQEKGGTYPITYSVEP